MVVSSSGWVRPAQAMVYTEDGEVKYFPPRAKGNLPRALTFRDQQEWRPESSVTYKDLVDLPDNANSNRLSKTDTDAAENDAFSSTFVDSDQFSFLLTSEAKDDIDDPPEEYESFQEAYSRCSLTKERISFMNYPTPTISTPTEQYSNIRRHTHEQQSPPNLSPYPQISNESDDTSCISPLLQTDHNCYLSLDELVELYAQKMETDRAVWKSKSSSTPSTKEIDACIEAENLMGDLVEICTDSNFTHCDERDNNEFSGNQGRSGNSPNLQCKWKSIEENSDSPMQLVAFDIHLLLQKLDLIIGHEENSAYEDIMCISTQELESLLIKCCRKTVEFEMME